MTPLVLSLFFCERTDIVIAVEHWNYFGPLSVYLVALLTGFRSGFCNNKRFFVFVFFLALPFDTDLHSMTEFFIYFFSNYQN